MMSVCPSKCPKSTPASSFHVDARSCGPLDRASSNGSRAGLLPSNSWHSPASHLSFKAIQAITFVHAKPAGDQFATSRPRGARMSASPKRSLASPQRVPLVLLVARRRERAKSPPLPRATRFRAASCTKPSCVVAATVRPGWSARPHRAATRSAVGDDLAHDQSLVFSSKKPPCLATSLGPTIISLCSSSLSQSMPASFAHDS